MKTILLLIVGFISVAQAELFVGEVNKPLEFDIKTAGFYKITLEGHLVIDLTGPAQWDATLTTLIDSNPVLNPTFHLSSDAKSASSPEESKRDIHRFEIGHYTISGSILTGGEQANRITSTSRSTWKYTVNSAEEIDYRNSIGDLQKSIDQKGTDIAGVKNDIATLQSAVADQNKGLSEQVTALKKQADKASDDNTQSTATILSAVNGVSQQVSGLSSQVTTVNNNVTSGNKQNQTLGIIGISLGTAGLGAGIGMPLMMEHRNDGSTDVSGSLDSDKDSINYVAPGKGD